MVTLYLVIVCVFMLQVGLAAFFLYQAYVICGPGEAIVKTGFGGTTILYSGGVMVLPLIQRYHRVSLEASPVTVEFDSARPLRFSGDQTQSLVLTVWLMPIIDDEPFDLLDGIRALGIDGLTEREKLQRYYGDEFRQSIEAAAKKSKRDAWFRGLPKIPPPVYQAIADPLEDFHQIQKITLTADA